jgi:hypothetical protein
MGIRDWQIKVKYFNCVKYSNMNMNNMNNNANNNIQQNIPIKKIYS